MARVLTEDQKESARKRAAAWYRDNKERAQLASIIYYKKIAKEKSEKTKLDRKNNPDKYKEQYQRNRVRILAESKAYVARNKEKVALRKKIYRVNNQEKIKAYYQNNKVRIQAKTIECRKKNILRYKENNAAWKSRNRDKTRITAANRRARSILNGGKLSIDINKKLMRLQRGLCACCRCQLKNTSVHLDHVIPLALSGRNDDFNIQLLCATCNLKKSSKHPVDFMQSQGYLL